MFAPLYKHLTGEDNCQKLTMRAPDNIGVMELGRKRLYLIHARAQFLLEEEEKNEKRGKDQIQIQPLCAFCAIKADENCARKEPQVPISINNRSLFIYCSGTAWVCQARQRIFNNICKLDWDPNNLLTKEDVLKLQ